MHQLTYPLGVAIGIACAGAVVGEAACLSVYLFLRVIVTKLSTASCSSIGSQIMWRRKLRLRSDGRLLRESLKKLAFEACWLFDIALSRPVSFLVCALGKVF